MVTGTDVVRQHYRRGVGRLTPTSKNRFCHSLEEYRATFRALLMAEFEAPKELTPELLLLLRKLD